MIRFDRRAYGLDLRLAEFLALAPVSSVAAFATWVGVRTAIREGNVDGLGAAVWFFVGGLWVMAIHYLVATIPSVLAWGLTFGAARFLGFSDTLAVRLAAPVTAAIAALLLFTWLRDEDFRAMIPSIVVASVIASALVASRLKPPPA